MKINRILSSILLIWLVPAVGYAGDVQQGKILHDENCIRCHVSLMGGDGSGIYVRENRKIESYAALKKQVNRCRDSLGAPWPEHQVDDIVTYLNSTFYNFETGDE